MPSGAWGPASETVGGPSEPTSEGRAASGPTTRCRSNRSCDVPRVACCCREGMPVDDDWIADAGRRIPPPTTTTTNPQPPEQRGESVDGIRCEEKKRSEPPRQVGGGHHRARVHSRIVRQQLHQL